MVSWDSASLVFPGFITLLYMVTILCFRKFLGPSEVTRNRHPVLFVFGATGHSGLPYFWYSSYPEFHWYSLSRSVRQRCWCYDNETPYHLTGAIDSGVVGNVSNIEWHYVVPFAPEGASNNVSSYLYWALELYSISVSHGQRIARVLRPLALHR